MPLLSKKEFEVFEQIINLSQKEIKHVMGDYLVSVYGKDKVIINDAYIYVTGTIPVALIAHLDTVWEDEMTPSTKLVNNKIVTTPRAKTTLLYDQWKEILHGVSWSGFDDRAGIYAIHKILESGLRPSIILTTDEEVGGLGAKTFANHFPKPLTDIRYLIELDRRGVDDCVFYNLQSSEFEKYVEGFGFIKDFGSFSDICSICPVWEIAGVNLSIGYFNEHTTEEVLDVAAWRKTIERVKNMLSESDIPFWKYEGYNWNYNYGNFANYGYWDDYGCDYDDDYITTCKNCNKEFDIFDTRPLLNETGTLNYYCMECYDKMHNCAKCSKPFYKKHPSWNFCKSCAKENRKKK